MFDFYQDWIKQSAYITMILIEIGIAALILYAWINLSWLIENWMSGTRKGQIKFIHKWFWIGIGVIAVGAAVILMLPVLLPPALFLLLSIFVFRIIFKPVG
jgi:hypothetical protein